jgi:hypothetical protein
LLSGNDEKRASNAIFFPGMDPYLEVAGILPDFYEAVASEIRAELNLLLPQPYYQWFVVTG